MSGIGRGFNTPRPSRFAVGYVEYIKSAEWRKFREEYFLTHYKACRVCKSPVQVQLHHLDHQNYRSKNPSDYIALCKTHHADVTRGFQKRSNRSQNMRFFTLEYIAIHRKG